MTEYTFTPEQVASICEITQKLFGGAAADDMKKSLITTKFAEGQVFYNDLEGKYMAYHPDVVYADHSRPLNQTEVGPDWVPADLPIVPRAEFDKLRDAAQIVYDECMDDTTIGYHAFVVNTLRDVLDAIPENLK